jgi:hypothetical protein
MNWKREDIEGREAWVASPADPRTVGDPEVYVMQSPFTGWIYEVRAGGNASTREAAQQAAESLLPRVQALLDRKKDYTIRITQECGALATFDCQCEITVRAESPEEALAKAAEHAGPEFAWGYGAIVQDSIEWVDTLDPADEPVLELLEERDPPAPGQKRWRVRQGYCGIENKEVKGVRTGTIDAATAEEARRLFHEAWDNVRWDEEFMYDDEPDFEEQSPPL